ncbi:ankyrin repeat domain-containing protein 54-like [Tribolium madens]|uniref:ankyrin repeat domain-containing protein 54-like n=1 Tax=Tribolium madens TaxID=41895 RepID=UPI001CF7385D|nr:ankyrin repeat domain-containing protein 54-like [Tribolium madens]
MSHSDSEVNRTKGEFKKKLHVELKAKNLIKSQHYAALKNRIRTLRNARLLFAAASNNTESIEKQLALGASPNSADVHGRSALHIAASKGYTDVVKLLLERGADPNQNDKLCNTPLHLAACTHNLSIISLLLKAGADVRKLDLYGKNPLQLAESKLHILQRSWREGSIEMIQVRAELQLIVDILISVYKQQTPETNVDNLQLMKLSLNSEAPETVDDQMSKLLTELQGIKIS